MIPGLSLGCILPEDPTTQAAPNLLHRPPPLSSREHSMSNCQHLLRTPAYSFTVGTALATPCRFWSAAQQSKFNDCSVHPINPGDATRVKWLIQVKENSFEGALCLRDCVRVLHWPSSGTSRTSAIDSACDIMDMREPDKHCKYVERCVSVADQAKRRTADKWCCSQDRGLNRKLARCSCDNVTFAKLQKSLSNEHYEPAGHLVYWEPERRWNRAGVAVTL